MFAENAKGALRLGLFARGTANGHAATLLRGWRGSRHVPRLVRQLAGGAGGEDGVDGGAGDDGAWDRGRQEDGGGGGRHFC